MALLEKNPRLYTRLIKMPKNGGKGAAVKAGAVDRSDQIIRGVTLTTRTRIVYQREAHAVGLPQPCES